MKSAVPCMSKVCCSCAAKLVLNLGRQPIMGCPGCTKDCRFLTMVLYPCEHRLCKACSDSVNREDCPICNKVAKDTEEQVEVDNAGRHNCPTCSRRFPTCGHGCCITCSGICPKCPDKVDINLKRRLSSSPSSVDQFDYKRYNPSSSSQYPAF